MAEMVDERIADLLAAAGFTGVECGLQSANPKALEAVNRRGDDMAPMQGANVSNPTMVSGKSSSKIKSKARMDR